MTSINSVMIEPTMGDAFSSVLSLRAAHRELLRRLNTEPEDTTFLTDVETFIHQARATGALLDSSEERRAAQSLLDLWANVLQRSGRSAPPSVLAEFDVKTMLGTGEIACPYQGLEAFGSQQKRLFYGRRQLIQYLVRHLRETPLLALVGPSGSGKSSLVLAGVLPSLQEGALPGSQGWFFCRSMVPGSAPLESLARCIQPPDVDEAAWVRACVEGFRAARDHLLNVLRGLSDDPVVLVVDQFEELFTLCTAWDERRAFINNLLTLIEAPDEEDKVIITLSSDYEAHVALLTDFKPLFDRARVQVTPLSVNELREVIERPAELVGLTFDPDVVDALVSDVLGDPAALPLLQFTLLKLWEAREDHCISWETYLEVGNGHEALKRSAEQLFDRLGENERDALKDMLLQMVDVSDQLTVSSHRVRRDTLYHLGHAQETVDQVLRDLIDAHLVREVKGERSEDDQVEVAHEALVRNWPRLMDWLEDERERVRQRQRLRSAVADWLKLDKHDSALYVGLQLDKIIDADYQDLTADEAEFVRRSRALRRAEEAAKEAQRQRELAQIKALAKEQRLRAEEAEAHATERGRLVRRLQAATTLVALLAFAITALALLVYQTSEKRQERVTVLLADEAQDEVFSDPQLSLLLAAEAAAASPRITADRPMTESIAALNYVLEMTGGKPLLPSGMDESAQISLTATSPGGSEVAVEDQTGAIYLWQPQQDDNVAIPLTARPFEHLAVSEDGTLAAVATVEGVDLFRQENGAYAASRLTHDRATALAFSQVGEQLAVAGADGVEIFRLQTDLPRAPLQTPISEKIVWLNFSPNGEWLAAISDQESMQVWHVPTGVPLQDVPPTQQAVAMATFSPDSAQLAFVVHAPQEDAFTKGFVYLVQLHPPVGSDDSPNEVAPTAEYIKLPNPDVDADAIAFLPLEAGALAAGGRDGLVSVWYADLPKGAEKGALSPSVGNPPDATTGLVFLNPYILSGHTAPITGISMDPAGQRLVTMDGAGIMRLWDASARPPVLIGHEYATHAGGVQYLRFIDDEQFITHGNDNLARLWNAYALSEPVADDWQVQACRALDSAGRKFDASELRKFFLSADHAPKIERLCDPTLADLPDWQRTLARWQALIQDQLDDGFSGTVARPLP